jgi:transmembrane sensor
MNVRLLHRTEPRTAAEWFAARRGGRNEDLEQRFSAWLAASERNFEAYALCQLTWELAASAAAGLEAPRAPIPRFWRPLPGLAAAMLLLVLAAAAGWRWLSVPAPAVWSTRPGEQRLLRLEDGTRITLNTRSTLEVRMGRKIRDIRLIRGEAFFDVAHEADRPFVVTTAYGTVRAVGTRFDVLLDDRSAEVNMEEGKVLVRGSGPGARAMPAVAGMRAMLFAGAAQPEFGSADLERVNNWRAHRIEFDRVPLAAALKEFSRYTPVPVVVASPEVGRMTISAVLRTGDINALRATLKGAFGLELVEGRDELVVRDAAH